MSIIVGCECGKKFRAEEEHAGKRAKCPACGRVLVIPIHTRTQSGTGAADSSRASGAHPATKPPIEGDKPQPAKPSEIKPVPSNFTSRLAASTQAPRCILCGAALGSDAVSTAARVCAQCRSDSAFSDLSAGPADSKLAPSSVQETAASADKRHLLLGLLIGTSAIVGAAFLAMWFFTSDQRSWSAASAANTVESYRLYLDSHPKGRHIAEALEKIEELDWQRAVSANTVHGYRAYLQAHTKGKHLAEAQDAVRRSTLTLPPRGKCRVIIDGAPTGANVSFAAAPTLGEIEARKKAWEEIATAIDSSLGIGKAGSPSTWDEVVSVKKWQRSPLTVDLDPGWYVLVVERANDPAFRAVLAGARLSVENGSVCFQGDGTPDQGPFHLGAKDKTYVVARHYVPFEARSGREPTRVSFDASDARWRKMLDDAAESMQRAMPSIDIPKIPVFTPPHVNIPTIPVFTPPEALQQHASLKARQVNSERAAADKLTLAKSLLDKNKTAAKKRLEEIVADFQGTAAAKEAEAILKSP